MMRLVRNRVCLLIACVAIAAPAVWAQAQSPSKVETGSLAGAAYRIEIPANWNRGLVVFAHGYTQPPEYSKEPPAMQQY